MKDILVLAQNIGIFFYRLLCRKKTHGEELLNYYYYYYYHINKFSAEFTVFSALILDNNVYCQTVRYPASNI